METLYKRTKVGGIQYWKITVTDNVITKESGQLGTDKPLVHTETVHKGVNEGKANETTPKQQAEAMAYSDWRKKKDNGYKSTSDLGLRAIDMTIYQNKQQPLYHVPGMPADKGMPLELALNQILPQYNTDASGNVKPMLATDWKKIKKIDYPVLVQPKLDGVRCLMIVDFGASIDDKVVTFLSRSGKEYTTLNHIHNDIVRKEDSIAELLGAQAQFILDGEIYSDELTFQEITQAVKKLYPNSLKLHFRAYDIVSESSQEDRVWAEVPELVKAINSEFIHIVPTHWVESEQRVREYHDLFVQGGYEGAMIRIPHGKYEQGCRSRSLLKVKEFNEAEFDFHEWTFGQRDEDLIAVLLTGAGKEFRAKMIGSREEKNHLRTLSPRKITVKHFGWTDDGLPRFPVGKAVRDYE